MRHPFPRLHRAVVSLWERAKNEHSTPSEIGWAVGVGAFVACTPLLGLHLWIALGLATLLRLNRLWTIVGSRLSTTPALLLTTFSEIEAAHRLRTGGWVPLRVDEAMSHGRELLLDWVVGAVLVGGVIAAGAGLLAYAIARWRRDVTSRRRATALPPSSEWRPSRLPPPTP